MLSNCRESGGRSSEGKLKWGLPASNGTACHEHPEMSQAWGHCFMLITLSHPQSRSGGGHFSDKQSVLWSSAPQLIRAQSGIWMMIRLECKPQFFVLLSSLSESPSGVGGAKAQTTTHLIRRLTTLYQITNQLFVFPFCGRREKAVDPR